MAVAAVLAQQRLGVPHHQVRLVGPRERGMGGEQWPAPQPVAGSLSSVAQQVSGFAHRRSSQSADAAGIRTRVIPRLTQRPIDGRMPGFFIMLKTFQEPSSRDGATRRALDDRIDLLRHE